MTQNQGLFVQKMVKKVVAQYHGFMLVMRSHGLLLSTLTLPVGTNAETTSITSVVVSTPTFAEGTSAETQRVVRQMHEKATVLRAAYVGYESFDNCEVPIESVKGLFKPIVEGRPKGIGTIAVIDNGLRAGNDPVAFFSVALLYTASPSDARKASWHDERRACVAQRTF
jgi:hypothetical protein